MCALRGSGVVTGIQERNPVVYPVALGDRVNDRLLGKYYSTFTPKSAKFQYLYLTVIPTLPCSPAPFQKLVESARAAQDR